MKGIYFFKRSLISSKRTSLFDGSAAFSSSSFSNCALAVLIIFIRTKMAAMMMRKLMRLLMKEPYLMATASVSPTLSCKVMASFEKSIPPRAKPIGGMMMSDTKDYTTVPMAPPMTMPVAISTKLLFRANSLNSLIIPMFLSPSL